jgi:hypothetical protein
VEASRRHVPASQRTPKAHELRPAQDVVHEVPEHAMPPPQELMPLQQTVVWEARLRIVPAQELTPLQMMSHGPEPAQAIPL